MDSALQHLFEQVCRKNGETAAEVIVRFVRKTVREQNLPWAAADTLSVAGAMEQIMQNQVQPESAVSREQPEPAAPSSYTGLENLMAELLSAGDKSADSSVHSR